MSIPYEQACPSNTDAKSPYMRLPSYTSLRPQRYRPYATSTTRTRLSHSPMVMMEPVEDADFDVGMLLARADPNPVSFSLPTILEDDCMGGLRTVVSQMIGRDNARVPLGSVHLVIDFALILRNHRRKNDAVVCSKSAT